mgnify:CR=1 FL=1
MSRNRQIYQCDALLLNDGTDAPNATIPSGNMLQLHRVQDGNFGYTIAKEDVNQWGQLGRIDTVALTSPDVSADFTYFLHNLNNEVSLGFHVSNDFTESFTKNLLSSADTNPLKASVLSGRNYAILTSEEGLDANIQGFPEGNEASVISIGKAYLSDYSIEASVGSIPTASFSIKGSNQRSEVLTVPSGQVLEISSPFANEAGQAPTKMNVDVSATSVTMNPYVDNADPVLPSALRPGDILLDLQDPSVLTDFSDALPGSSAHVQSFSMNIPFSRTPLERLGNTFAFAEEIDFPIQITVNISAIVADLKSGSVFDELTNPTSNDLGITFKGKDGAAVMKYIIKDAQIESESLSQSIGSNKTVDLTFTAQVGGPNDVNAGVFVSGVALP